MVKFRIEQGVDMFVIGGTKHNPKLPGIKTNNVKHKTAAICLVTIELLFLEFTIDTMNDLI